MLTGFRIEFRLVTNRATGALQKKVCAFATRKLSLGSDITCHLKFLFSFFLAYYVREPLR